MKIHRTSDTPTTRPVLYRHAKCKNCDHEFTYHVAAAENDRGTRPECPECENQGIGGPFGRTNPAEYLSIIQQAADSTPYEYADWLAGEAAMYVVYNDEEGEYLFVKERKDYLPCRSVGGFIVKPEKDPTESGGNYSGWSPHIYDRKLEHDVDMRLVDASEVPDGAWF